MKRENSQIVKTVRHVMPAVVSIVLTKHLEQLEREFEAMHKRKSPHARFNVPADRVDAHGMVEVGGGSGFIVDKSGIILTNRHVIDEHEVSYTVITNEGTSYPATLLARDPVDDIAILRITPSRALPTITLGNSQEIELGQTVLAFGNALGIFKNTVSMGIVSGLSRSVSARTDIHAPIQEMRGLIQTDAAINPGNSGGPLVNIYGEVVGINAAVVSGAENISFAIPINAASRDIMDVKKYGHIRRPLFGVHYLVLNKDIKEKLQLPVEYGALVARERAIDMAVIPNSPAGKSGIREHDILLTWNGNKITPEKSIQDYLEVSNVGEVVTLTLLRNGIEESTLVTLAERK